MRPNGNARSLALFLLTIPAWAACSCGDSAKPSAQARARLDGATKVAAPRSDPPSVLLLTLDTTRADALHCYGAEAADASPELDALAASGVRFDQGRTTVPMSLPSHATILTGRWPFETGVRDNMTFQLGETDTLARRFKAAGYATGAVVASYVLHSEFGLNQGFDEYLDVPSGGLERGDRVDERKATEVTDECLKLLDARKVAAPFFLWAHYFDPHLPYAAPEPFHTRFLQRAKEGGEGRARYAGEVAFMDREIGRLLKEVRQRLDGRPLVILVVGDHGEGLGDHGEDSHGMMLYDGTLHVPFIVAGTGVPAGRVVASPASTVDVAPTLLELCGLGHDDTSGVSLVPAARFEEPLEELANRPLYYEVISPYLGYGWSPTFAVQFGRLKFIDGARQELFDVLADPGETKSILDQRPDLVRVARAHFGRWKEIANQSGMHAKAANPSADIQAGILRTGYVGGDSPSNSTIPAPGEVDPGRRDPRDGTAIVRGIERIQRLGNNRKLKEAVAIADALLTEDPNNPMVQQVAGTTYLAIGEPARALPLLEAAVAARHESAMRFTLGECYEKLGRLDDALTVIEAIVKEHPELLRARRFCGELLLRKGRAADAIREFEAFLARYPRDDAEKKKVQELLEKARAK